MAKILVIEDDKFGRELYLTILRKNGHEAIPAETGREGLGLFDESIDLVITDIIMEQMDGYEVIGALRSRSANVKIIAISGSSTIGTLDTLKLATKYGAQAVLAKPINWKTMVKTIADLLAAEEPTRTAANKWSDHDGMMAALKAFLPDHHSRVGAQSEIAEAEAMLIERGYPADEVHGFLEVVWEPALNYYLASLEEV